MVARKYEIYFECEQDISRVSAANEYKASELQTLRNSLRRHYLEKLGVDIVNDKAFSYSAKVFKASVVVVTIRRQSLGTIQHHPAITKADMTKLFSGDTLFSILTRQTAC